MKGVTQEKSRVRFLGIQIGQGRENPHTSIFTIFIFSVVSGYRTQSHVIFVWVNLDPCNDQGQKKKWNNRVRSDGRPLQQTLYAREQRVIDLL